MKIENKMTKLREAENFVMASDGLAQFKVCAV